MNLPTQLLKRLLGARLPQTRGMLILPGVVELDWIMEL